MTLDDIYNICESKISKIMLVYASSNSTYR